MKKKTALTFLILSVYLLFLFFFHNEYYRSNFKPVSPEEIDHASNVLFYKDNCPECKELLKESYIKLKREGTVFVNMNNKENKKYREKYAIVFVPTLYMKEKEYIGKKDIQKQLNK